MAETIKFIKAVGVDHYIQRLYVHWDVTTLCQYKCSYCYARSQYNDTWGTPGNWEHHQFIIDELCKAQLPVFLGLLGGEPTLHQRYFELVHQLTTRVIHHPDSRLYITTNGAKPTTFYDKHPESNGKIYMLWSLHPEYTTDESFETFYDNVVLMHEKGYKTKINLMLHPGKRHWEQTKYRYNKLNELDYAILHPHFIYTGFDQQVKYSAAFYEYFAFLKDQRLKEFVFSTSTSDMLLTDYDIFSNKYNQFAGWDCWHNNYEIDNFGRITDRCFGKSIPLPVDFFKNISAVVPRKCPHQFCSCDGLMKIHKENNAAL